MSEVKNMVERKPEFKGGSADIRVVYDVASTPENLSMADIVKIMENHKVVLWDSNSDGVKPKLYANMVDANGENKEVDLVIVDLKGKNIDVELYTKEYEIKMFWDKELYNCMNSPTYYFSNYATTVYPATAKDTSAFMRSIGVDKVVAKDSDEAKELWAAQRERVKEALSHITVEHLKERNSVLVVLKENYNSMCSALEDKLKPFIRLLDSNGVHLSDAKRTDNLLKEIRKYKVIDKYAEYKTSKEKWDHHMIKATSYGVLLEMVNDVLVENGKLPSDEVSVEGVEFKEV